MANLRIRVLASAGDQVLSSVSNAVILFAIAGPSSIEEFGAAVLVFSIITAAIGLVRGAMGTPLLLMSAQSPADIRAEAARGTAAAAVFGLAVGLLALGTSVVLGEPQVGIAYAIAVPIVLAQDVLRFSAMALGTPERALISDAIWALGAGAVLVTVWVDTSAFTIPEIIWLWSGAALLGLLYLARALHTRPHFSGLLQWWTEHWKHRARFGLESGIDQISAIIIVSISTAFIGTVAAASLRGAVTVLGPFAVLISSLPLIVIPEAVRAGHDERQVWSTLRYAAWITSAMAVIIGFLTPFVPDAIGRLALGDSWEVATHVLPFLGLEYAAICWIAGVYNFYRSQGASSRLLRLRIIQSVLGVVICTIMAASTRTAVGVAIGLALSSTLVGAGLVFDVQWRQRTARRARAEEVAAAELPTVEFAVASPALHDTGRWERDDAFANQRTVAMRSVSRADIDLFGPRT